MNVRGADGKFLTTDVVERFFEKVEFGPDCHLWRGWIDKTSGYGLFFNGEKTVGAHRFALELATGPLGKLQALHGCDNKPCVRVGDGHLYRGDHAQNMRDLKERNPQNYDHRIHVPKGEGHAMARLSKIQVEQIRENYLNGDISQRQLANLFGISQTQVGRILRNESWKP